MTIKENYGTFSFFAPLQTLLWPFLSWGFVWSGLVWSLLRIYMNRWWLWQLLLVGLPPLSPCAVLCWCVVFQIKGQKKENIFIWREYDYLLGIEMALIFYHLLFIKENETKHPTGYFKKVVDILLFDIF